MALFRGPRIFCENSGPDCWPFGSWRRRATGSDMCDFGRVVKGGNLRLHPVVAGLVDGATLHKMRND